jgi:hypothetical protein
MKLRITGGELEVEILEGELTINDVRFLLKKLSKGQIEEISTTQGIAKASPNSSKSNQQGKLNAKPKMPI